MTNETAQEFETPRRKFDDVASLFGTIVPAPGAVLRPVEDDPPSPPPQVVPTSPPPQAVPTLLAPGAGETPPVERPFHPAPALAPTPMAAPAVQIQPSPELKLEPAMRPRPRPKEVPWPDAFEPRPNFRRREPRNWSWLLLIPVGFVAAVGITMLDPPAIRNWLDANVLHRTSIPATVAPPPLTPAPNPQPPPPPAAPAEAPVLYPALPTSPVPVPPGTEVSPPPPDPAAPVTPAAPAHITIQYRRNIPGADGEARRMAALLQGFGGSVELHPNATTVKVPTINYYNAADKTTANGLASALANEAATWTVRPGTGKNPPGTLDVWLP